MKQGFLTTHALDIYSGIPGKNLSVDLFSIKNDRKKITSVVLNEDGRCDKNLLEGKNFFIGEYVLTFHVGEYFKNKVKLPEIQSLNEISLLKPVPTALTKASLVANVFANLFA